MSILRNCGSYVARGQSVIVYQHQTRERGGLAATIPQAFTAFRSLGCENTWALVFRRRSVRVYYVLASQRHRDVLRRRTEGFLQTQWGRENHFELVEPDRSTTLPDAPKPPVPAPISNSSPGQLSQPDPVGISRAVRLFQYLAERANRYDAVGISYGGFIAYVHGASSFQEIAKRNYLPSDSDIAVRVALRITGEAGGRITVSRGSRSIPAGMDTFIWNAAKPFDRPPRAWMSERYQIPYTREEWLRCFPDGARRIISDGELSKIS